MSSCVTAAPHYVVFVLVYVCTGVGSKWYRSSKLSHHTNQLSMPAHVALSCQMSCASSYLVGQRLHNPCCPLFETAHILQLWCDREWQRGECQSDAWNGPTTEKSRILLGIWTQSILISSEDSTFGLIFLNFENANSKYFQLPEMQSRLYAQEKGVLSARRTVTCFPNQSLCCPVLQKYDTMQAVVSQESPIHFSVPQTKVSNISKALYHQPNLTLSNHLRICIDFCMSPRVQTVTTKHLSKAKAVLAQLVTWNCAY